MGGDSERCRALGLNGYRSKPITDTDLRAALVRILGTERVGSGVAIRGGGLILTIGYLVTEAESIWITTLDGRVVPGHPLAYDFASGFGVTTSGITCASFSNSGIGSTGWPLSLTSKWRCGPVELPVLPDKPIT
jgi:hypothetical protein